MIPVKVSNLSISNMGFVVMLQSQQDERTLPIFIGVPEAQAIALQLNDVKPPRPMTHDLLRNILDVLEGRLDHVEVHDMRESTFYGKLVLVFEGQKLDVDSRPSDAIALALRLNAPIFVAAKVMDEAGIVVDEEEEEEKASEEEVVEDPNEKLQKQLDKAVREERYEDAAHLRDELKKRTSSN